MTNSINSRDDLLREFDALLDSLAAPFRAHLDNLHDDFHDATSDYLAIIPRFAAASNADPIRFYADYDASLAALELTDADLALILIDALRNHECESDC